MLIAMKNKTEIRWVPQIPHLLDVSVSGLPHVVVLYNAFQAFPRQLEPTKSQSRKSAKLDTEGGLNTYEILPDVVEVFAVFVEGLLEEVRLRG